MDERCNIRKYEDAAKELPNLNPLPMGGVVRRKEGMKYSEAMIDPSTVRQVTYEGNGSVLVATINGVFRFKDGKGELIS